MGLLLWRRVTLFQARSCPMWALAASLDIDSAKGQLIGILGARHISRYFPAIPTRQSYLWFRSVFRPNIICAFRLKKIGITQSLRICISDGQWKEDDASFGSLRAERCQRYSSDSLASSSSRLLSKDFTVRQAANEVAVIRSRRCLGHDG